jgi:hypothetical protein
MRETVRRADGGRVCARPLCESVLSSTVAVKAATGLDAPASEHNSTADTNAAVRVVRPQPEHSVLIEAHETLTTEAATLRARNNKTDAHPQRASNRGGG